MEHQFDINDVVVLKYHVRAGQAGKVIERQPGRVYKIQFPDGEIEYHSDYGLMPKDEGVQCGRAS